MRKLIKWLGGVPKSIKRAAEKALGITTKILKLLESQKAINTTDLIPGNEDEAIRLALIRILKSIVPAMQATTDMSVKKALAGRIGAELVAAADGGRERMGAYVVYFEAVYAERKG